jgi:hypothetical protein
MRQLPEVCVASDRPKGIRAPDARACGHSAARTRPDVFMVRDVRLSGRSHTLFLHRYGTEADAIYPRVSWHAGVLHEILP